MTHHYRELLAASRLLLARGQGQRGRLSDARIRRAISTAYYAIFHFLLEESAGRIVGRKAPRLRRRRVLARTFSHTGMKIALQRLTARAFPPELEDFLSFGAAPRSMPAFVLRVANTFIEAQAERHSADYNLNSKVSEVDAIYLLGKVETAIDAWRAARSAEDDDLKDAVSLLMLLRGRLRGDDG